MILMLFAIASFLVHTGNTFQHYIGLPIMGIFQCYSTNVVFKC